MLRIVESAFDEIRLDFFEFELLLEIIDNKIDVNTILACVDIG